MKDVSISLLSVAEAGRETSLHRSTVYGLIKSGVIPAVKLGRSIRIRRADLAAAIERNRIMTRTEALS